MECISLALIFQKEMLKPPPVEKGDFCGCQIYEDRQLTHSIFFEAFATQIYVTLKSGQLLKATGHFQLTFE